MKKVLRIVMTIIQTILIIIGVLAVLGFVIPSLLGYKPRVVKSGSMEPTIKTGAVAYNNTHAKVEDVKEGDIIVFQIEDAYVTHRVVAINDDNTFTTKGDANKTEDVAPIQYDWFRGKMAFSIPYVGYVLDVFQTKVGVFTLILVTGLNIIYFIFSEDEKDKKEKNK